MRPYCSPDYFARVFKGKARPAAWTHARLLHEDRPYDMWTQWFTMRRLGLPNTEVGLYFSHGTLAILAAIEGEGVTLQPPQYVEREVATGTLVAADATTLVSGLNYYLVWPKRPLRPAAEKFKAWVMDTAHGDAKTPRSTTRGVVPDPPDQTSGGSVSRL